MGDDDTEIVATAEELRAAVEFYGARRPQRPEELIDDWMGWFRKRAAKIFKDAAVKGLYQLTLDLPYQPRDGPQRELLRAWRRSLHKALPGCRLCFIEEEEADGAVVYTLEVGWQ